MKKFTVKITSLILLVCCAFAAVSLSGCSENSNNKLNDKIVGEWYNYDKINDDIQFYSIMKFDDGGNLTIKTYDAADDEMFLGATGTYSIESNNTLKVTWDNGKAFTLEYDESAETAFDGENDKWFLSGDKLYWSSVEYDRM